MSTSDFLFKGPCESCGSSDANAIYSDGHTHCFSCGAHTAGTEAPTTTQRRPRMAGDLIPAGEAEALPKRGLTEETCRHFGYTVSEKGTDKVHVAPYYKDGALVAQHLRGAHKAFSWRGGAKGVELFGQHLWRDGGKKVVVTEGELDAMSVSQLQGNKWPVVSLPSGAQGAAKALKDNLEWLERFDEVILMFDQDDPGKAAMAECAPLFTPGRCKLASLPLKDANDMLMAKRGSEVIDAIWGARPYRPEGVVSVQDLVEAACADLPMGTPWFLPTLTALTYGRRDGELYAFGAGTGIGKTDLFTQSIAHDIGLGIPVGVLYLEQPPVETLRRIAGKTVGKVFHVPGKSSPEDRRAAVQAIADGERLHLYDHFGATDWETVKSKLRYMVVGLGCRHIYLDHLTALVAQEDDEKKALDKIMSELAGMGQELRHATHFISHLTTPEGKPHEEGGRVSIRHFRGSRSIGFWSNFMFGLERDQQAEDPTDRGTTLRVLKDRNTGQATGKTIPLSYDPVTGLLAEGGSCPFLNPSAGETF